MRTGPRHRPDRVRPAPAPPAPSVVWRLDYYLPINDTETIWLQQAADDILKHTTTAKKGGLKIEIYPANSLKLPRTMLSICATASAR